MNSSNSNTKTWGRSWQVDALSFAGITLLLLLAPPLVFYFYIACTHFGGSLLEPLQLTLSGSLDAAAWGALLPPFSFKATVIFGLWMSLQVGLFFVPDALHYILPGYAGGKQLGSITPGGLQLEYQINGLQAWVITHVLWLVAVLYLPWFSPAILVDEWGSLLWVANGAGYTLAIFAYVKAYLFPSHPEDRKFSGQWIYDFFMGIEFNPRLRSFDFKLFFNGRPGIVAWTLINLSFAAKQYQLHGMVTNSMIIVNILQGLYVLYFFWNEAWYLRTIDIAHDHFGWMLAWGDLVWLPYMYTLQCFYLVYNPVQLSTPYALFVVGVGLIGYFIFHTANRQKERFRQSQGKSLIWGEPPEVVHCEYLAQDGKIHQTKLLASGWWGIARHFNYTGDLIGCLSYSLACGFTHILPYFYFIFLSILLIHRCIRDEHRCFHKYGRSWEEYYKRVPWRLIPGIY